MFLCYIRLISEAWADTSVSDYNLIVKFTSIKSVTSQILKERIFGVFDKIVYEYNYMAITSSFLY